GLITYMRTDSFRVADIAQQEAIGYIKETYGPGFAPPKPNVYASRKGSQGAHEAIRPSSVRMQPSSLRGSLTKDQYALYKLVWERFLASQMAPAVLNKITAEIAAGPYLFRATDTRVVFPGYLKVAGEPERDEDEVPLPPLRTGEPLTCIGVTPSQHFTNPPPRYTEATLVKELEEKGIGRPSTYSPIISTILKRSYVLKEQGRFHTTSLGEIVNKLLVEGFPELINVEFTAHMEDELDAIEEGTIQREQVLKEFYEPFIKSLEAAQVNIKSMKRAPEPTSAVCEKCGHPMVIRHTLKGHFLACSAYPKCRNIKPIDIKEDGTFSIRKPVLLDEKCPQCGQQLMERHGRFGNFIACSGYPACRYIKPKPTGVKCPQPGCGGDLVHRKGKGGSRFYGCSNYPACKFNTRKLEGVAPKTDAATPPPEGSPAP
ncbi:MAG: DNA topoisomerase, partial [Candidatus Aureabacteria bacterium]|nr:DNA topoisomerase [Candidatus Auribacterota bacterium]